MTSNRLSSSYFASRSEAIGRYGMVASSHLQATQAGIEILKAGGNAVDAAIATNAVLAVVEPTGCGIGGDIFVLLWHNSPSKLFGLNGSGRSPRSLTLNELVKSGLKEIPKTGALSVSVPGCIDGWFELHSRFCNLQMKDILHPAITIAKSGFPVTEVIALQWNNNLEYLKDHEAVIRLYSPESNSIVKGEIFRNPQLAMTLERIVEKGRNEFYEGEMANIMASSVKEHGGYLSLDDLKQHSSEWIEAVSTNYRSYDIWELPPNTQGIAVLQMLNLLESYNLSKIKRDSAEYLHLLIEIKKLVYEDRAKFYSDPSFADVNIDRLISKGYAARRKREIRKTEASDNVKSGKISEGETVYLSTADKWGNMVSLIQSNYMGMGSGIVPEGLGFVLQNRGCLFSLDKDHANCYSPGKRPFHTIIPGFVSKDNKPFMSFGVMGGDMQPQGHVQILSNIIDFGMNIQEAGDAPRIRHDGSSDPRGYKTKGSGLVLLENGFSDSTINKLKGYGHNVNVKAGGFGGYQAIQFDNPGKVYFGASEYRKDGCALGY